MTIVETLDVLDDPLVLPQIDAAARIGVDPRTLRRWVKAGWLHPDPHPGFKGATMLVMSEVEDVQRRIRSGELIRNGTSDTDDTERSLARSDTHGQGMDNHGQVLDIQALSSLLMPLVNRIERQAEESGELRALLAHATEPKIRRASRQGKPRMTVPLDPPGIALTLMRRLSTTDLNQVAVLLSAMDTNGHVQPQLS